VIELSEHQRKSIEEGGAIRVQENGNEYVVLRPDVYEQLVEHSSDDSAWTAEEMDRLREEAVSMLDRYGKEP
jgi:hypothetical protein